MGEAFTIKQQNGVVDDIYTFTPSIINQAVFGITNSVSSGAFSSSISNSSLGINMPNYLEAFNPSGAVAVNVGNQWALGGGYIVQFSGIDWQISDNLSWTRGSYSTKSATIF